MLKKACDTQTANCNPEVSCEASSPVCSTCCDFVNNLPGSGEFKQAGNDYCRSLNEGDATWGAECDTTKNEDGTAKAVCLSKGDVSWQKEAATIAIKKIMKEVVDLENWKTTVDMCILENGKCKTFATKDDNNKTMNMANIAIGLSLLCLVFLIIFLFVKKK